MVRFDQASARLLPRGTYQDAVSDSFVRTVASGRKPNKFEILDVSFHLDHLRTAVIWGMGSQWDFHSG